MNFPFTKIEFSKSGKVGQPGMVNQLLHMIGEKKVTDLFVVSHGWNNDMDEANLLYQDLFRSIESAIRNEPTLTGRSFGVLQVFWPSKKFADEQLIPTGAASVDASTNTKEQLLIQLKKLRKGFDAVGSDSVLKKAEAAVKKMDKNAEQGAKEFVDQMKKLVGGIDPTRAEPEDQEAQKLKQIPAKSLLLRMIDSSNGKAGVKKATGGAASTSSKTIAADSKGGAAGGFGDKVSGIFEGARNLLNYVTYYQMKERAGTVGELGLKPVLTQIFKIHPGVKLHLIGHSFGARLVTAATAALDRNAIDTLVLLQGAFSHYGFAKKFKGNQDGLFRSAITGPKVRGVVVITHTQNDTAVGKAYAIASRIAWQTGSSLGKANDLYGGMGANGAQKTPEANNDLTLKKNSKYNFARGKIYNLLADSCISDHSDICGEEVGRAIAAAIR